MTNSSKTTYFKRYGSITISIFIILSLQLVRMWYRYSGKDTEQISRHPNISYEHDWKPSQKALDYWENKASIVHCPHRSDRRTELLEKLEYLVATNESSCVCPSEITFFLVTDIATHKIPVSEKLYQLCGCRYVHIRLDNKTEWPGWQWSYKVQIHFSLKKTVFFTLQISPLLHWLEENGSSLPKDSYVMFTDAFDTGLIGDATNMVQGFLGMDTFFNYI